MPAKNQGESTGLIVALVFFVLAFLVTGVVAYFGYADQDQLAKQKKEALEQRDVKENERKWYRFLALQMRDYLGEPDEKNAKDLATDRKDFDAGTLGRSQSQAERDEYKKLVEKLDKKREEWNRNKPNNPNREYATYTTNLTRELAQKTQELDRALKDLAAAKDDLKKANDDKAKAADAYQAALEQNRQNAQKDKEDVLNQVKDRENQIVALKEAERKVAEERDGLKKQVALLQEEKKIGEEQQKKAAALKTAKVDLLQTEQPKGEVYSVENTGETVLLRLATTKNLPPQQTFVVRGKGEDGRPLPEAKASLTVTGVLDDRLCTARVTQVKDRNRDPIRPRDFVFSIGWDPNLRQHVALAGLFDLAGATRDGGSQALRDPAEAARRLDEFRKYLERQGLVVDAVLDPKTLKVEGKLTLETDFLIVGDVTEFSSSGQQGGEDGKNKDAKNKTLVDAVSDMTKDAIAFGVTVVPYRKWLALSGYRLGGGNGTSTRADFAPAYSPLDRKDLIKPPDK